MSSYTSPDELEEAYSTLFATFRTGRTKSLAWRKWQLKQFWWMIVDNEERIVHALHQDLHRHPMESKTVDIHGLKVEIMESIIHLEEWAADEIPDAGFIFGTLGKARVRKEPLGVALIIGAWNFPFALTLQPAVAATAAGCCVMIKPSELSRASEELLKDLVSTYLDSTAIRLVTGGPGEMGEILKLRFNHVFFTGSSKVARFVTEATAKHLTPTVLELGGQGPAIIYASADVNLAAKRIAWAKWMTAGQICLSVNHVFTDPTVHDEFVERLKYWNQKFEAVSENEQMCRIINERNFDRLTGLLEKSQGDMVYGGKTDRASKYIQPTIVTNVDVQDSLMTEELFGPICPVIKADTTTAYRTINSMPLPLGMYIFSRDSREIDEILNNTNSGGVTINDVVMHAGVPNAPFGGVGESGYGTYHGKYGFDTFSHLRTVVALPTWLDRFMDFRYPPYGTGTKSRLSIKNRLGFKRGESMEDQVIVGRKGVVGLMGLFWLVVGLGAVGYATTEVWTRWGRG